MLLINNTRTGHLGLVLLLALSTIAFTVPRSGWTQPMTSDASETGSALPTSQPSDAPLGVSAEPLVVASADSAMPPDYLLSFAPPDLSEIEVPGGMSYDEAQALAEGLLASRFSPALDALSHLRQEGLIAGVEVHPELLAVIARGVTPSAVELLASVPGVAQVTPFVDSTSAPCSAITLQALADQVHGLSQIASAAALDGVGIASLQSTPPKIHVRASDGSSGWSYFFGQAAPNTVVTMRILRAGATIATGSTTSDSAGGYGFYPSWQGSGCGSSGYTWSLQPGDVVEVTAGSQTVSTVVARLHAWADPSTDIVAGQTDPGRQVEIVLSQPGSPNLTQTVSAGSSGAFSANFSPFDGRASARVAAFDANGHGTFCWISAYHVRVRRTSGGSFYVDGSLKPQVSYSLVITRSGSTLTSATGQTNEDGRFGSSLSSPLQPNDIVFVTGGGVTAQYAFAELSNLASNVSTGTVSGKTAAGREVRVCRAYSITYSDFNATCSFGSTCPSATANSSGAFAVTVSGLLRGDRLEVTIFDSEGNRQVHELAASAIRAYPENQLIRGFWIRPDATLTVTVRRPDNTTASFSPSWSYFPYYEFYRSGISVPVGSVITVTDGALTETMQVQTLTVRVNESNGQLSGIAANGHLIAVATNRQRYECAETSVNGAYSLGFSGTPLRGQSLVYGAWLRGADGHYTGRRDLYAFTINAFMNTSRVTGYTEQLSAVVTVTLQRVSSTLATVSTTSDSSSGFYSLSL
ncbi:MAG: hypothetical protein NZ693_10205, partial [Thermoflexales bacterium]|nr:hypothetical protein [Thermoflexales bacterium]